MGADSKIQWTDHTFNPWWGCHKISPGCDHCYAESLSKRTGRDIWGPPAKTKRMVTGANNWKQPYKWNKKAAAAGVPARVFCASMADVFEAHPDLKKPRERLFAMIRDTPYLDWQLLTKRPQNIMRMLPDDWGGGYQNVWIGTSVENQEQYLKRVAVLKTIPAKLRFLSIEPLLGYVNTYGLHGIHWVIVGGESGHNARPMVLDWVHFIRNDCENEGIPFLFKQAGSVLATQLEMKDKKGGDIESLDCDRLLCREFPETRGDLFNG